MSSRDETAVDRAERWQVAKYDEETGYTCIETVERGTDLPDRGYEIAQVSGRENSWRVRLIAAAPELLEALETAHAYLYHAKGTRKSATCAVRAAIRKAMGE